MKPEMRLTPDTPLHSALREMAKGRCPRLKIATTEGVLLGELTAQDAVEILADLLSEDSAFPIDLKTALSVLEIQKMLKQRGASRLINWLGRVSRPDQPCQELCRPPFGAATDHRGYQLIRTVTDSADLSHCDVMRPAFSNSQEIQETASA